MSVLGKYRNKLGVELEVTGVSYRRDVIGVLYEATVQATFGPENVWVTMDGLTDCGYEKVASDG